jgi:hypothetical protein
MPAARSDRFSRDSAPYQSKSVTHPFPSPRTAAPSGRATHDSPLRTEKVRFTSGEQFDDGQTFESDVSISGYGLREGKGRRLKIGQERGSFRRAFWDDDQPSRNRDHDTLAKTHAQVSKPKGKLKTLNKTQVEVFIPSTVSVGNLARILKVPLGGPHFV